MASVTFAGLSPSSLMRGSRLIPSGWRRVIYAIRSVSGGIAGDSVIFAGKYYGKARERYAWAAQDCMTLDQIPYIGRYGGSRQEWYVATGFGKWGMTSAMVAALVLRDYVLERENPYAPVFSPARHMKKGQLLANMVEAAADMMVFSTKRCPHMGCALKWNGAEHSWDCPCHGSRFSEDGRLLENPATTDGCGKWTGKKLCPDGDDRSGCDENSSD